MSNFSHTVDKGLNERIVYTFYLNDRTELYLQRYSEQYRETTRHGWKNRTFFNRLDRRGSTLTREEIHIPSHVIDSVKTQIFNAIQFIEK